MKPVLLSLSLVANVALLAGVVYLTLTPRSPGQSGNMRAQTDLDLAKPAPSGALAPAVSSSIPKVAATAGLWQSPADVQALLVSLRAPLDVRYVIAQAMFDEKNKAALDAARFPAGRPRWQRRQPKPEQTELQSAIRRQQDEALQQLFGADYAKARYGHIEAKSGLSSAAMMEINRVTRDYMETGRKLGLRSSSERQLLDQEMNADLARVLTPADYETYRAYDSPDGARLQRAMAGLDIDDETYLRAFRAMAGVKATGSSSRTAGPLQSEEIRAIEQAVGPEVAAHLAKNQDRRRPARPLSPAPPAARPSP